MKNYIQFISVLLVIALCVVSLPTIPLQVSAAEDWRTWKQSDERWGSVRLGKSSITMSSDGCAVTSVAKIMVQSGFVDPNTFNPLTLVTWLNSKNYFTETGGLHMDNVARYIDGFELAAHTHGLSGKSSDIENQILELVRQKYHVILKVGGHFIAVDHYQSLAKNRVYIMDTKKNIPNADVLLVDRYSQVDRVTLYSGWSETAQYPDFSEYITEEYPCYLNVTTPNASNLWNMPCSDKTSSEAEVLDKTTAGGTYTADYIYKNSEDNYWYRIRNGSKTYYLYSGNTSKAERIAVEPTVTGLTTPSNITQGSSFSLRGNISSPHLPFYAVGSFIFKGDQAAGSPIMKAQVPAEKSTDYYYDFDIRSSVCNQNLKFGDLPEGTYTYWMAFVYHYWSATGNKLNYDGAKEVTVAKTVFTVGGHVCDKGTYMWQWDAHPHYSCYKCSVCGEVREDTSQPNKVNTCDQCRPGKGVLEVVTDNNGTTTFTWEPTANTTHYNVWLQKQNDAGDWQSIEQVFYAESGFSRTFDPGNYRAQLLSYSSEMWEPDNSDWVHTWADDVYFTISNGSYTIHYDANGGSGAPSSQTKTHGRNLTLSTTVPSRFGYTFLGWSTSSGAVSATYLPGDSFTTDANTTLYAVWQGAAAISSDVTSSSCTTSISFADGYKYYSFTPNFSGKVRFESTGSLDTRIYLYDAAGNELIWDDDNGDNYNFLLDYSVTSGTKYYLKVRMYSNGTGTINFSVKRLYDVIYNANGGTGAPDAQIKVHGEALTLSSTVPSREGYSFWGWSTNSVATTVDYQVGDSYTGNRDLTLFAIWAPNCDNGHSYTVTVIDPTCTWKGYTIYRCSVCDDWYQGDFTEPLGHSCVDGICQRCGQTFPITGTCGENAYWKLEESAVLTIYGMGAMDDYTSQIDGCAPWVPISQAIMYVRIEDGITTVGNSAFAESGGNSVVIGDSVVSIGERAFERGCSEVILGKNVKSIGYRAFSNCGLRSIVIPSSVEFIDTHAFVWCTQLEEVIFRGNAPAFGEDVFLYVGLNVECTVVYYPADNPTWTSDVLQEYGGNIIWVEYSAECTEHIYQSMVTNPTCTEQGYTTYTCTNCGDSYVDNYTDPVDHVYVDGYCKWCGQGEQYVKWYSGTTSLNGTIDLNIYVLLSQDLVNDPNTFVRFTYDGNVVDVPMADAQHSPTAQYPNRYRFSCPIYAKQLADKVNVVFMKGSEQIGKALNYSVVQYCENQIKKVTDPQELALYKAMLNYGAAAQQMFNHNLENLANASLSDADKVLPSVDASAYKYAISGKEDGIKAKSATLMLEDVVKVRVYFTLTGTKTIDDYTFTIDGKVVTPQQNDKGYYVESDGIAAKDLEKMFSVQVGGITVKYGALSFVNSKANGTNQLEANISKALYVYWQAADSYLG